MARYFNTKRSLANYQSEKNGFLGIPFGIRERMQDYFRRNEHSNQRHGLSWKSALRHFRQTWMAIGSREKREQLPVAKIEKEIESGPTDDDSRAF